MKITRDNEKFEPITIVLETMEEARVIKTLCGSIVRHSHIHNSRNIASPVYRQLDDMNIEDIAFNGSVEFKE